mmetsp:Transcript_150300/g.418783  ORF Transcript_150300/g.418783 Transcript_150300/m.418783 type:complete len:110 (-) Transcript_150300:464-793(-)
MPMMERGLRFFFLSGEEGGEPISEVTYDDEGSDDGGERGVSAETGDPVGVGAPLPGSTMGGGTVLLAGSGAEASGALLPQNQEQMHLCTRGIRPRPSWNSPLASRKKSV